jgi:hypothetical protein
MALAWIGATTALGTVVRKLNRRCSSTSPFRSPTNGRQMPAKKKKGPRFVQREPVCDLGLAVSPFAKSSDRDEVRQISVVTHNELWAAKDLLAEGCNGGFAGLPCLEITTRIKVSGSPIANIEILGGSGKRNLEAIRQGKIGA